MTGSDFHIVLPEVILALYAMAALLFAVYTGKDALTALLTWATAGLFVALALWIGVAGEGSNVAFGGMFIDDAFARFAKVMILLSAAGVLVMAQDYMARSGYGRFEYPILIALAVIGMMVMVSAGDLMTLYMGLELQSLSLYVVASIQRDNAKSTEAGLKYFVLGALSSGLLLYGASLVYGFAGTTLFAGILSTLGGERAAGPAVRSGVRDRGSCLQGVGGAVPHVDARCLRRRADAGDGVLCHRAEGGGDGADRAGGVWCLWRHHPGMEPGSGGAGGVVDVRGRDCRHRAARHQAPDGLFLDRPYGLCAGGSGGRHGRGRAGDADLHGDLCHDEPRHLCLHPVDGEGRQAGDRYRKPEHVLQDASR